MGRLTVNRSTKSSMSHGYGHSQHDGSGSSSMRIPPNLSANRASALGFRSSPSLMGSGLPSPSRSALSSSVFSRRGSVSQTLPESNNNCADDNPSHLEIASGNVYVP